MNPLADLFLYLGRASQVVGTPEAIRGHVVQMCVGVDDPLQFESGPPNVVEDRLAVETGDDVRRAGRGRADE